MQTGAAFGDRLQRMFDRHIRCIMHRTVARHWIIGPFHPIADDLLDIGNKLEISAWNANGRTQVQYRGSNWAAESADPHPAAGLHQIVDVQGNVLKVKNISITA